LLTTLTGRSCTGRLSDDDSGLVTHLNFLVLVSLSIVKVS